MKDFHEFISEAKAKGGLVANDRYEICLIDRAGWCVDAVQVVGTLDRAAGKARGFRLYNPIYDDTHRHEPVAYAIRRLPSNKIVAVAGYEEALDSGKWRVGTTNGQYLPQGY